MIEREIEKNPHAPDISDKVVELLTELCFVKDDDTGQVDLIFVYATPSNFIEVKKILNDLLEMDYSKKVFVTGGRPHFQDYRYKDEKTEAEKFFEVFDISKFPSVKFFKEDSSTNSLDNVREAMKVLDFSDYKRIAFIFKSHASRRGYLTLRKFCSKTVLISIPFNTDYLEIDSKGKLISRDDWHKSGFGRSRVWGEFLRIKKYGQRGDIEYKEVKDLVEEIDKLTNA